MRAAAAMTRGKGTAKKKMLMNAALASFQRALCHPEQSLNDKHRRLNADERRLDEGHMTVQRIGSAEREHNDRAGQHERKPATSSPNPWRPTDIGDKPHGLWPSSSIQKFNAQETVLADPVALIHEDAMHSAIWSAGPPKDKAPIFAQTASASLKDDVWTDDVGVGEISDPMAAPRIRRKILGSGAWASCLTGWPQKTPVTLSHRSGSRWQRDARTPG